MKILMLKKLMEKIVLNKLYFHVLIDYFLNIKIFRQSSCPLEKCKHKTRSKVHTLITKAKPLCLHSILAIVAEKSEKKKEPKPTEHLINFKATIEKVVSKIQTNFPSSFRSCEEGNFLASSKTYLDSILSSDNLETLLECVPSKCDTCSSELEVWKRKLPRSYLITLGKLSKKE